MTPVKAGRGLLKRWIQHVRSVVSTCKRIERQSRSNGEKNDRVSTCCTSGAPGR